VALISALGSCLKLTFLFIHVTTKASTRLSFPVLVICSEPWAYDIVHFFCGLSPGGIIADSEGATIIGSEFIAKCCEKDVKLLWVASGNKGDDYIKGFKVNENRLNLVMTLDRRGSRFSEFLEKLLSRVSRGETMPIAWAALAPQARGPWEQDLPSCIFSAGRGSVKLLS